MKKINHQPSTINHPLIIGWLYPQLMNIYGDTGNIITLVKRCEWRGIKAEVKELNPGFDDKQLAMCDLLVMGGAQDKQQTIVNNDLKLHHKTLSEMIDKGIPGLYVCGGFQFLGNYYKEADGTIIDGLGIFDMNTESPGPDDPRLVGNIAIETNGQWSMNNDQSVIVGFENHGGRTILGPNIEPLGKVLKGYGNNGNDFTEGARYRNSFGTYMHGPILPKNPHFADYLLKLALKVDELFKLDDELENKAQSFIFDRIR